MSKTVKKQPVVKKSDKMKKAIASKPAKKKSK